MTSVLIGQDRKEDTVRHGRKPMKMQAGIGVMLPQIRNTRSH